MNFADLIEKAEQHKKAKRQLKREAASLMESWKDEVERYRATKYGDKWRSAIQYPGRKRDTLTVANNINVMIGASATEDANTGEFSNWELTGGTPDSGGKKYFIIKAEPLDATTFAGGKFNDKPAYFDAWTTDWLGSNSDWLNDGDYVKHKVSSNSIYRVKVGGAWRPLVVFFNQVWLS